MNAITMASVQAQFAAEDAKRQGGASTNRQYLQLWNMPFNSNAMLRLLPRSDKSLLPFLTKFTTSLKFGGIVNSDHDTTDDVTARVPSMKTWDEADYIQQQIAPYWRGTEEEKNVYARPYYHKASFIYAAFVVSLPFNEQQPPENPIRLIAFTKQVQDVIKSACSNPDLEYAMWDIEHGRDLRVHKAQQGSWPNYSQSQFSFRERGLSDKELAAIEQYGLPDLEAELGEPPNAEVQQAIKEMYHASVAGEPFDNKRWGRHFRAFGAFGASKDNTTQRGGKPESGAAEAPKDGQTADILANLKAKTQSSFTAAAE